MTSEYHTPKGRGFEQALIYFHHCNSFWTSTVSARTDKLCSADGAMIDLWTNDGPAPAHQPGVYQEWMFVDKARAIMSEYAANATAKARGPLFLYYASHAVHTPMEVPQSHLDRFLNISELSLTGQGYAALVSVLDEAVGNLTQSLKATGLWGRTLLVFQSDNGGPIYDENFGTDPNCPSTVRPGMTGPNGRAPYKGTCLDFGGAASNHPLKGGKFSNFEGGVRAVSFLAGGFLPAHVRGAVSHALIATADWLGTFAALAGVDATDKRAAVHGLPPIDSVDQSPLILGAHYFYYRRSLLFSCSLSEENDLIARPRVCLGPGGRVGQALTEPAAGHRPGRAARPWRPRAATRPAGNHLWQAHGKRH